jgi:hypothetical protein
MARAGARVHHAEARSLILRGQAAQLGGGTQLVVESHVREVEDQTAAAEAASTGSSSVPRLGCARPSPLQSSRVFAVDPIVNRGPDADQFRDVTSGQVVDASDAHRPMTTFTAHRSPLGLSFDLSGALCGDFKNNAFILSWGTANPVFPDHGEDPSSLVSL